VVRLVAVAPPLRSSIASTLVRRSSGSTGTGGPAPASFSWYLPNHRSRRRRLHWIAPRLSAWLQYVAESMWRLQRRRAAHQRCALVDLTDHVLGAAGLSLSRRDVRSSNARGTWSRRQSIDRSSTTIPPVRAGFSGQRTTRSQSRPAT